jgi:hypothetical protein
MIKNIDLHKVLQNYQTGNVELQQDKLLVEAYNILNGTNIKSTINEDFDYSSESNILNELTITKVLDSNRIFSINEIRKVSIDYHLRFLDSKNYVAEIPYNVHLKCSAFELRTGKPVNFKVLTEANNFKAKYPNTQHLIFADLGNNEFYFIMKWGNPFSTYRKITSFPFKSFETVLVSVLLSALLITIITPSSLIITHGKPEDYFSMARAAFYFYCVIFFAAVYTYYIVALRKNLNITEWDSASFI